MKRLALIFGILFLMASEALANHSELIFKAQANLQIQVFVNNRCINVDPCGYVRVPNLYGGNQNIRIKTFYHRGARVYNDNIFLRPNHRISYAVNISDCGTRVLLRQVACDPIAIRGNRNGYGNRRGGYGRGRGGYGNGNGRGGYGNNRGCDIRGGGGRGYVTPRGYDRTCRHAQHLNINELIYTLGGLNFESDRLRVAKQSIRAGGSILAEDVKAIMLQFSFESSRLEFAKFAYRFTCDEYNYFVVNDAFQFSSSIRRLDDYIYRF